MGILEKINQELKKALKAGEKERAAVLRFILSLIRNLEIEKRKGSGAVVLSDKEIIEVLRREAKKRKEAVGLFQKGGREDLAQKEKSELKFFDDYLPQAPEFKEVELAIEEEMRGGEKDFGVLMKKVLARFEGGIDGKEVAGVIKNKLQSEK